MASNNEYRITMLGDFSISFRTQKVSDQNNRSKKAWNLIEYLIANRDRHIPQSELVDLLWDDTDSDNPVGALKVLLHRVRKSLEPVENVNIGDFILLKKGQYYINPDCKLTLDTDQFEETVVAAGNRALPALERITLYREAFALYRGDFLPRNGENWVIPINAHYHRLFLDAVMEAIDLFYEENNYEEIVQLCRKALSVEALDERLYYHLINALYKTGRQSEALEEYSRSTDMFYKNFGITPSDELKGLYKTIKRTTQSLETDIGIIKDALCEKGEAQGAFMCEYEFFKDIYQLEARACARSGDSIYLCLITLSSADDTEAPVKTMNRAMDDLCFAVNDTLRKGDVFARYSVSQYVILLPTTTYENVEMIMKRISSSFYHKYMKKDILIQYKLQPLDPKM